MPQPFQPAEVGHRRAAVVGGEDDNGVVGNARALQRRQHPAHHVVYHQAEVAVGIRAGFALELRRRQDGRVRRGQREIEKERFLRVRFDEANRPVSQRRQHVRMREIRRDGPAAIEGLAFTLLADAVGQRGDAVVFDVDIGRHVQRGADAEILVEATVAWAAGDGLRKIHILRRLTGTRPLPPQVPLAKAAGGVALVAQEGGGRHAPLFNERRAVAPQHAPFQAGAPVIPPGEDAVARGRADRRCRVGVGAAHPLRRHAVEVWRVKRRLLVEAGNVAVPHVIGEDVDDIGLARAVSGHCPS
ncbi:MAG: hypothetical protein BWY76_01617 [bacterium ADurb.Bin429]|nr:MAG: hypothetical protein BWY76_01617 [bacterium ADurb.Bin429]